MKKLISLICVATLSTLAYGADYVHILGDCTTGDYSDGYGYKGNTKIDTIAANTAEHYCDGTYDTNCEVSVINTYWQKATSYPCASCARCGVFDVYIPDYDETHEMVLCTNTILQGGFCELLTEGCDSFYKGTAPKIVLSSYEVGTDAEFTNKAQWTCCNDGDCTGYGYRVVSNYASLGLAQRGAKTCGTSGTCGVGTYSNWICNKGYYCNQTSGSCTPSASTNPTTLRTMCVQCSSTGDENATSDYPITKGPMSCYISAGTEHSDNTGVWKYTKDCQYSNS